LGVAYSLWICWPCEPQQNFRMSDFQIHADFYVL
jgi:hypothetical protein